MCSLVLMMSEEPSSLVGPFSFVLMSDESSSLSWAVGCCSKAVWTVTSIRFGIVVEVSVCLVPVNTRLLTWRF
jgi:hypothetical protein